MRHVLSGLESTEAWLEQSQTICTGLRPCEVEFSAVRRPGSGKDVFKPSALNSFTCMISEFTVHNAAAYRQISDTILDQNPYQLEETSE